MKRFAPATSLFALALVAVAGCSNDERVDPLETPTSTAGPTVSHPPTVATAPKRTVTIRSPYGNVAASDNLLWDGDFEWSSPFTDQYGWYEPPSNPTVSDIVVGAECKSGVKCARVKKSQDLLGIAVSSTRPFLKASLWVRFEPLAGVDPPACDKVDASLLDLGGIAGADPDVALEPVTPSPNADGWCQVAATTGARANKTYLYVRNISKTSMLVDDAVIVALDTAPSPAPLTAPQGPRDAEHQAAYERARAAAQSMRLPQDGRARAAREAFEAHMRSK